VSHATRTADAKAMGLAIVSLDLWGAVVTCVRWVSRENTATSCVDAQGMAIALSTGHVSALVTHGWVKSAVSAEKTSLEKSASGFVTAMSIAAIADDVRHMASAVATTNSRVLAAATVRQAFLESLVRKYAVATRRAEDMEGVIMMGHANVTRVSPGQGAIFARPKAEMRLHLAAFVRRLVIGTLPVLHTGDAMETALAHVMVDFKEMSAESVKETNLASRAARNHASRIQPAPPTVVVWQTVLVNALEITLGQIAVSVFLV